MICEYIGDEIQWPIHLCDLLGLSAARLPLSLLLFKLSLFAWLQVDVSQTFPT